MRRKTSRKSEPVGFPGLAIGVSIAPMHASSRSFLFACSMALVATCGLWQKTAWADKTGAHPAPTAHPQAAGHGAKNGKAPAPSGNDAPAQAAPANSGAAAANHWK